MTKTVSNREICFIKAVLLLCEQNLRQHFFSEWVIEWVTDKQVHRGASFLKTDQTVFIANGLNRYTNIELLKVLYKSENYVAVDKDFDIIINTQDEGDRWAGICNIKKYCGRGR